MNERIKQLAEQAGLSHMPSNYPDMADLYKGADFELENFAELIVRECIEIVEASKVGFSQVPAEVALDLTAKNINSYFGIKDA